MLSTLSSPCAEGFAPDWNELLSCLRNAQPHFAMAALKTLLNSWCTNARYHDTSANVCIFGCGGANDDIVHYPTCPTLWEVSCHAARTPLTGRTEERLLLLDPDQHRLNALVTAFTVYHAVKLGHRAAVDKASRTGKHDEIQSLMASVALAHSIKFGLGQDRPDVRLAPTPVTPIRVAPPSPDCTAGLIGMPNIPEQDKRPFCEPECSDLPLGRHHACCSQAFLEDDTPEGRTRTESAMNESI